jgi:hypothetical protein
MNKYAKKLREIKKTSKNKLEKYVISYILRTNETDDDIKCFFNDLTQGGCQSGFINDLIYYNDTHTFAKKYAEEIAEILDEIKDETGEEFGNYKTDRLNTLAWLGFEETARHLSSILRDLEE